MMKKLSADRGLAMVEFTILLPLLLFLLITIMELGRAFYTYTELEKLSRDSARYLSNVVVKGALGSGSYSLPDDIEEDARNLAIFGSISKDENSVELLPDLEEKGQINIDLIGNRIQVEIIYPFKPVLNQLPKLVSNEATDLNFNMTSSYTMRILK